MIKRITFVASALALSLTAFPMAASAQNDTSMPQQTTPCGIKYIAGGVGDAGQQAMQSMRKDYNLRLTFARPNSGAYLADVKVTIENSKMVKVLDVVAPGPFLYSNLPNGRYTVTAAFEGTQQTRKINMQNNRPRSIVYYFAKS